MTSAHGQSGDRPSGALGTDPSVWSRRLRRILDEQIGLYEQLDSLSARQLQAISNEDADQLLVILGEREAIIGELLHLNEDLSPFVSNWATLSAQLPPSQRDALGASFDRVAALVEAISERDERDRRELEARRERVKTSLVEVSRGKGAVAAYSRVGPTDPPARFQDREG